MDHSPQLRLTIPGSSGNLGPGFDCLGLSLGIYNHFSYNPAKDYSINFSGEIKMDAKFAQPQNNLVVKSYEYACQIIGEEPQAFALDIEANIPMAAGMGSSGTAILAGCAKALIDKSAGKLSEIKGELPLPMSKELLQLAGRLEGHPDNVGPSIYGGFVISVQEEDSKPVPRDTKMGTDATIYTARKFVVDSNIRCLIIKPQVETITAESRLALPADVSRSDAVFNIGHAALVAMAFATKEYEILRTAVSDRMHESYRDTSYNYFGLKSKLLDNGAVAVALSGSGPSILVLTYEKEEQKMKDVATEHFKQIGLEQESFVIPVDNRGILINQEEIT